jgi:hypothetical protein
METFFDLLLLLIPLALLAFAFRPVRRTTNSLRFSPFAPAAPMMCLTLVVIGMQVQEWAQWRYGLPLMLFFAWGAYAGVMFGYVYDGTTFSWFNGLWRRSVSASSIRLMVWRRGKNRIGKVRFECEDGNMNMRTDFPEAVTIVRQMAQDHGIETRTETLSRWSI